MATAKKQTAPLLAFQSGFQAGEAIMAAASSARDAALALRQTIPAVYTVEKGFPRWKDLDAALENAPGCTITRADIQRGMLARMDADYTQDAQTKDVLGSARWDAGKPYRDALKVLGARTISEWYGYTVAARTKLIGDSAAKKDAADYVRNGANKAMSAAWDNICKADNTMMRRTVSRDSSKKSIVDRVAASPVKGLATLRDKLASDGFDVPVWLEEVIEVLVEHKVIILKG